MLKLKDKHSHSSYQIIVTDSEGNKETFDNAKAVAEALEVKIQTVRSAICYGLKVRGCTLKKVS